MVGFTAGLLCAIEQGHQALIDGLSPAHWAELEANCWPLIQWYLICGWIAAVFSTVGFGKQGERIVKFTDPNRSALPFANVAVLMLERGDSAFEVGMAADLLGTLMVKPG